MKTRFSLNVLIFFTAVSLLLLAPYTVYGRPDVAIGMFLIIYTFYNLRRGFPKSIVRDLGVLGLLLVIAIYGSLISIFFVEPQHHHASVMVSYISMYLISIGLLIFAIKNGISNEQASNAVICAVGINSLVIITSFLSPSFRLLVESYLTQFEVDYSAGFKYRGIASAGGAGLSVLYGIACIVLFEKFLSKNVRGYTALFLIALIALFFATLFLVGRTGILIVLVASVYYLFRYPKLILPLILLSIILYSNQEVLNLYLQEKFDSDVFWYSIGFLFEGKEGLENEGTLSVIDSYWFIPLDLHLVYGYGFYGIGPFSPWTDSGYIRTVLSVGLPLAFVIYFFLVSMLYQTCKKNGMLLAVLLILLVVEIKEPFLFSGFGLRAFLIMFVFFKFRKVLELKLQGRNNLNF